MKKEEGAKEEKMVYFSVLIFILAVIVIFLIHIKNSQAMMEAIPPNLEDLKETILVILVSCKDRSQARDHLTKSPLLKTVERLFEEAAEPSRVFVAAYDFNDHVFPNLHESFQTNVKVARNMKKLEKHHYSAACARNHLIRSFYNGERFILTLDSGAELATGWDAAVIKMLKEMKGEKNILISSLACDSKEPHRPTYLGMKKFSNGEIFLSTLKVSQTPDAPLTSLFWTPEFSFAYSHAYKTHLFMSGSEIHTKELDLTLNSLKLFSWGYSFHSLPLVIGCGLSEVGDWRMPPKKKKTENSKLGEVRTLAEFQAFAGLNFENGKVKKRTYRGLTNDVSAHEAGIKVGSLQAAKLLS